ncbi:MAG: hypothetical protein HOP27_16795 [Anaerolineales bacterium]|jgi:hypothetical protein|nr:hypothetical protein [Anaerolineales bacterium]
MKIIKVLSLFILFLLLQGCSLTPSTPSLERAVNFEKGISKIPEGYYIFLEFRSRNVCSDECHCAPEAPAPLYEITSAGELWIERDLEGFPASSSPIVGFFVFNDWGGRVYAMDTLPFTLQPGIAPSDTTIATVYSVDAEGTAVVEVYGETYFIKPGQAWTDSGNMRREPPAGCHISYSTSLTNFGLFSQTQIRFGNPDLHP